MIIRELNRSELDLAASLLSRAMRDNPNNVAAFGGQPDWRESALAAFFRTALAGLLERGVMLGAFDGATLQGVCGMVRSGRCSASRAEKLRLLWSLLVHGSFGTAMRFGQWAREWSRHDPFNRHWHLGPVAVDPRWQGQGIGSAMLEAFCVRVDQERAMAYLEADKHENVGFYEKYGFKVVGESLVLGQPNWYMSRQAK